MRPRIINRRELPDYPRSRLRVDEVVFAFEYTDVKSGCAGCFGGGSAEHWVMVTDWRVIYDASVQTADKFMATSGSVPLGKLSGVGTRTIRLNQGGCSGTTSVSALVLDSHREIVIVTPTLAMAEDFQDIIDELLSRLE